MMNSQLKNFMFRHPAGAVLLSSAILGIASFVYCYFHGLTAIHYDAKAHLVVARRMIDSTTPGYAQMGAHWLPLIHLLYLPFVFSFAQYQNPVMPALLSVAAFSISGALIFRISRRLTESNFAAFFAAAVFVGNPNLLLLQSAPLTEPIYIVLSLLAFDRLLQWRDEGSSSMPWSSALWLSLAALCRYEGWLLLGGVLILIGLDARAGRMAKARALKSMAIFAATFAIPAGLHFAYIYQRLGDTFFQRVARGNPEPYETFRRPLLSLIYHLGELSQAAMLAPLLIGFSGLIYCLMNRDLRRRCLPYLLLWLPSAIDIAALFWGLIYRVRYSTLLIPAIAVFGSIVLTRPVFTRKLTIAIAWMAVLLPWISWAAPDRWEYHFLYPGFGIAIFPAVATLLFLAAASGMKSRWALLGLAVFGMHIPILAGESRPLLLEAREHEYIEPEQRQLLKRLQTGYDGSRILIDIGRLAPLIYDSGLPLKAFIYHDGDRSDWDRASASPSEYAGWMCAEKGDEIWNRLQVDPGFADGYSLELESDNYRMYRLNRNRMKLDLLPGKTH
jgi:hypothetical protein